MFNQHQHLMPLGYCAPLFKEILSDLQRISDIAKETETANVKTNAMRMKETTAKVM